MKHQLERDILGLTYRAKKKIGQAIETLNALDGLVRDGWLTRSRLSGAMSYLNQLIRLLREFDERKADAPGLLSPSEAILSVLKGPDEPLLPSEIRELVEPMVKSGKVRTRSTYLSGSVGSTLHTLCRKGVAVALPSNNGRPRRYCLAAAKKDPDEIADARRAPYDVAEAV